MSTFHCTEIQVEKPRVFPSGHHGDKCKVGDNGVTAIEYSDGAMVITGTRDGKPCQFIVRDWLHGKLADDSGLGEFTCKTCGTMFKNSQGLGLHVKTCGTKEQSGQLKPKG
jgi:hypothetical protein